MRSSRSDRRSGRSPIDHSTPTQQIRLLPAMVRTNAIRFPSGLKTHASGRGGSPVFAVNRVTVPIPVSMSDTDPSTTQATRRPSGCHVNAEAIGAGLSVACCGSRSAGSIVQNCATPRSSLMK